MLIDPNKIGITFLKIFALEFLALGIIIFFLLYLEV
jgi:hypothetical protein